MDMIREAGWPVYIVLAFGGLSIVTSLRYAAAPRPDGARLVKYALLAMFVAATMGVVLGVQMSAKYIGDVEQPERLRVFLCGLRESLQNMALASAIGTFDAALLLVGVWRLGPRVEGGAHAMPAQS
jgi:hypothetical protein